MAHLNGYGDAQPIWNFSQWSEFLSVDKITFFERFEADILSGVKTITIRDEAESHFKPGSEVDVATFEDNRHFCRIKIKSVEPISFANLNERHAQQENMTLTQLRQVITDIYPGITHFFVISFDVI